MTNSSRSDGARGPRSCLVPYFTEKLDALLLAHGRDHAWLASHLNISESAISNWKRKRNEDATVPGRVPEQHIAPMCRLFGIAQAMLLLPALVEFHAEMDRMRQPGTGLSWDALLQRRRDHGHALELLVEGGRPRYSNLAFFPATGTKASSVRAVALDQRVRLAFSDYVYTDLGIDTRRDDYDAVLCCADREGWQVYSPSRHDGYLFALDRNSGRWQMPPAQKDPLFLGEPVGLWKAVALVCARRLPPALSIELKGGPRGAVAALDLLADWVAEDRVPHVVMDRSFMVMPA